MNLAPVVLFTYNRPWHLRQTVEALQKNELAADSELFIFSDGPKTDSDVYKVEEVRKYIKTIDGFKNITIVERDKNWGLADNIIDGVTRIVNQYGKIIVLEDDLVTGPYFLRFMNDALDKYEYEDKVACVSGYVFPIKGLPETFFIKGADCLGWGTWERGWKLFEKDGRKLLKGLRQKNLLDRFDLFGAYGFSKMLKDQIAGKNQSWAIRWYASALLHDKLILYPGVTLLTHIGSDGSGTHCGDDDSGFFEAPVSNEPIKLSDIPVEENTEALEAFSEFLRKLRPSLKSRILRRVNRIMRGVVWR